MEKKTGKAKKIRARQKVQKKSCEGEIKIIHNVVYTQKLWVQDENPPLLF